MYYTAHDCTTGEHANIDDVRAPMRSRDHTIVMRLNYVAVPTNYQRVFDFSGPNCGQNCCESNPITPSPNPSLHEHPLTVFAHSRIHMYENQAPYRMLST